MSTTVAIGLILFLVGGLLGVLLLIARTTYQNPGDAGLGVEPNPEPAGIGDAVILVVAIISLFGALIGLWLLVGVAG